MSLSGENMGRTLLLPRASCLPNWCVLIAFIYFSCFVQNVALFKTVEVYEGLPPGSSILNLKPKPGIVYSLHQDSSTADSLSLFYIDSNGVLTSKVTLDHEDERGNVFDLLVISREISRTEGGFGSIVRVRILDRNDNPPKFPKDLYTCSVAENSRAGTYVQGLESVFADDLDSGKNSVHKYSIVAGNEAGKFDVDFHQLSGVKFLRLKTKAPIDREETPFFVLTIQVEDGGNTSLSSTTQVRVNILDENDQTPKFEPPDYSVAVSENVPVGTSVLQVKAFDGDTGTNAEIYYFFKPEHDFFIVDAHTGTVETACELNFEKGNSFDLTVYAVDRGKPSRQAKTLVRVRLVDIAAFPPSPGAISSKLAPPVFHKHSYFVRIREDFPVGGAIVRVNAHQGGLPQTLDRTWRYIFLDNAAISGTVFHINPRSGVISLREPLDYENKTSFEITVKAEDERSKDLYDSHARVVIVIQDVSENYFAPIFSVSTNVVYISENAQEKSLVSRVSATDADESINGEVTFTVTGGSGLGKFAVDQSTGEVRSFVRFTSEMESQFDLHVRASDRSKQPLFSNSYLLIKLRNSGLKRPFFYSPQQLVHVRENSEKGTFVALIRAKVRSRRSNINKVIQYFISGGNEDEQFSLNSTSGIISTTGSLDRESKDRYILDVYAQVKGAPSSTRSPFQVVVMVSDENDNSPSFEKQEYKVSVTENIGPISNLLCLAAHDPDSGPNGNLTYSIISGKGPFSINPVLGVLTVDKSLDYEKQSLHRLVIQAADHGVPSRKTTTKVDITVQDANDAPVFSQSHYEVTVLESAKVGTDLLAVFRVTDEDAAVKVSVLEDADVEGTVSVLETSDQDRDKNGKFTCDMEDMDLDTMDTFTVRRIPEGCALVLLGYLDWASASQYSFRIRATDDAEAAQRKSAVASVTVNVQDTNNHDPEFLQSSYWVSLPNDANMGATVLTVKARDLDQGTNAAITYKLSNDVFSILPTKGIIKLKQGLGSLTNEKYEFSVRATDQGTPNRQSAVSVTVSVHALSYIPPRFPRPVYRKGVDENFKTGVALLTVRAQKRMGQGSSIEYFIVGGDPLNQFSVGTRSGVLTLKKQLDYERVKQHVLVVRAVQNGISLGTPSLPTEAKVIVNVTDVNDNRPRFALPVDPLVISVDEFQPPGTRVAVVKAFDKDTGNHSSVTYTLNDRNFHIHSYLGIITTESELYHSQGSSRTFVVTATESTPPRRSARANVVVMINKATPPPRFSREDVAEYVPEDTPVGNSPVECPAQSRVTLKYWIPSGNEAGQWCIDTTGKIRVNKPLDHEYQDSYHLKINVADASRTHVGPSVLLKVQDINDNVPSFSSNVYTFYVAENSPEYHTIAFMSAMDGDKGSNGQVKYSIVGVEDARTSDTFQISAGGQLMTTEVVLDRELMEKHVIVVRAEDEGKPSLSSVARVTVVVTDVNDNSPVFDTDRFRASVPVDTKVGSRIFAVVASDMDWAENGLLSYSIIEGNSEKFISVDSDDGSVIVARPLTSLKPINFKVMARDLGEPVRNATADVIITIHAVEGPPRFLFSSYEAHVTENKKAGTEVIRVEAASVDPVISYRILQGNARGDFHLDEETGWITTAIPLDYETVARYDLVVMAIDSSNRMNYVQVAIKVVNLNDNEPYFVGIRGGVIEGQILANAITNSHVMWLKARDRDASDVIAYKIRDKKAASYFTVDSKGSLKTKKPLTGLRSPFDFRIEATDSGTPPKSAFTSVRLVFLKYHMQQKELQVSVSEDVKQDDVIIKVKDAAKIKNPDFSIISPLGAPFRINSRNGEIRTSRPLDFETTQNYSLIVQVQNSKDLKDYANIDVMVKIEDVNDNSPAFDMEKSDGLYVAKVNRNPLQGTVVYTLTASDRDSRGHLRFSLVSSNDGNAVFEVEAESGKVKTLSQLVLMADSYNLTVRVSDSDTPSRDARAILHVQVGEYLPSFSQDQYIFTIKENTQRGFTIGHIKAHSYSGTSVSYTVVHGNVQNNFILDSNTGRLALPNPLDYERDSNVYYIRIRATEVGILSYQSSEVNVQVLLQDVNDNAPEFSQQRYRYTLPESAPVGTTVLSVSAQDSDSGINGQFRYYMENSYFTVNPYTGEITTTKPLDYETARSHTFVVVAQDGGSPVLNGTARVEVTLQNVNDNPPRFSQPVYNEYVTEDAGRGELVTTVQASDLDLDPVSYSIMSGDNSSNFVIDSRTGVVRLVKHREPNLVGPYYVLNISASDGLHSSQAVLVVAIQDINNHKPVFRDCDKYRPIIAENLPPGSPVIQVSAEDGDMGENGQVNYHIERPTIGIPYFKINSSSGQVTTSMMFDREEKRSYQIRITGRDGGPNRKEAERLMGFCQVEIKIDDVNDNAPVFGNAPYRTNIKEDLEKGDFVLHVSATDKDAGSNSLITYSFETPNDQFAISNTTGVITTKSALKSSEYQFVVIARDNGDPPQSSKAAVFISVYKVGKDPPKFKQNVYTARVREDAQQGKIITRVQATSTDPNNMIFYTIVNFPQPVHIDPLQGIVTTKHPLDYELAPNYTVLIQAQDTQDPPLLSFTRLEILVEDVNDSPPEFPVSKYEGQVAENAPIGSSVLEVKAKDPDKGENGRVKYKFSESMKPLIRDSFHLDPQTGLISTKKIFDREKTGRYNLIVEARDHGKFPKWSSCLVNVIISDKNDNSPVFEHPVYNASVFEDAASGTGVLQVSARDDDIGNNAVVNYYIVAGNTRAAFEISKDLGQIVVASSLDRETQDFYRLKIRAQDGKNSGTAVVNIRVKDVNDNNPVFSNHTYVAYVYENRPAGSNVATLSAADKDLGLGGEFTFSIGGQGTDAFEIDPMTGVMKTIKPLDRELKARYDFLAFATDNPGAESRRTGSCDVVVWIRDINDNPPQFPDDTYEGSVKENQKAGARVMAISAVDKDDPNENGNAVMTYQLIDDSNGLFRIDRDSGVISTRVELDREKNDRYRLVVNATDRGRPALWGQVEVMVRVTDVNDHPPLFSDKMFFASVFENASIDSSVMRLKATDNDIGINARLRYSIIQGGTEGMGDGRRMFRIVEDTGVLQVARSLDYERNQEYKLTVRVRDSSAPFFSDAAEVVISILDYNDNPPVFNPVSYSVNVREDVIPEEFLLQVTATDSDTGSNKDFKFSIYDGDREGQFRIDPKFGNLYVHRKLDRETRAVYLLRIRATNTATPPLYGHASVKITLVDVNDNGPTFHPSVFHFSVKENTAPSQSIGKISVDDPDLDPPNGGPFFFEISSGNDEDFFMLDNKTGEFFTRATFDREKRASYMLGIQARDSGTPQQHSKTFLYVHILDDNDHQHSTGKLNLELNSYQGKFPGGKVGKVYVVDKDTDDSRFYEVLTNSSEYFTIERTTGVIISLPNPPKGDYFLTARVSDLDSSFTSVTCYVFIKVKEVSAEAVHNSMAVRLGSVSREGFITTVMPRFKESVASILGTKEENVDLFSVQDAPKTSKAIDVRFAAHGSPYYAPERMTAILKNSRPSLAKALEVFDVDVLIVGVDECLHEPCESGRCTNILIANGEVEVISVKGTSFASIVAILTARCDDCDAKQAERPGCESSPCLNGGTCQVIPEGHVCRCLTGFDGPNCEFTTRSFEPGEWMWLPPPRQCSVGSLSLEFASRETDGLLLYGGPTSPVREGDVHDFIAVELTGGKIRVSMSLGDRNDVVRVGVTGGVALDDGEWHHVEVYRNGTFVLVMVDKCKDAPVMNGHRAVEDMSQCSSSARMRGDKNKFLNLNNPLQLGGVSTANLLYPKLSVTSYKGCIRNVVSQGTYYDLKTPSHSNGTKEGCPILDQNCRSHDCDSLSKCVPSWTGFSCSCPFGFFGSTCGQRTRALTYADSSFTQYLFHLHEFVYKPRETKIHMQIRTRDPDGGVLMFNAGSEEGRFSLLEVVPYDTDGDGKSELIVKYTLGLNSQSSAVVQLTGVNVGNGQWHNISVWRERTQVTLSVDSDGDGYSVTEHLSIEHTLFVLDPTRTFVGGLNSPTLSRRRRRDKKKDFVGCINDVRLNGHPLRYYNGTGDSGKARSIGVTEGCSASPVCEPDPCVASEWCRDIWRKFVCLPRLCTSQPCQNGGTCVEGVDDQGNSKFYCRCPPAFEGALCEVEGAVVVAEDSGVGFEDGLIIGLSVLVVTLVLSVCILLLYLRRSRPKKMDILVDEDHFKRDNVASYRIEGGGEEDLEEEGHVRDILRSFETNDFSPLQNKFKLSGSNSDVNGPFVVLTPIKTETDARQRNGIPAANPVQRTVQPDKQEAQCSFSHDESDQEPPDSYSSPSAVSTPERRRRVRTSSKGEVGERHSPEGGEGAVEPSPTRKLTEVFGLTDEEQEGMRSPPEGFSSPEKYESLSKRERGNGASLQRPDKTEESEKPLQNGEFPFSSNGSFAMENPLCRPNSDLPSAAVEDGFPPIQRNSLPPRKPPRSYYPRGVPPPPGNFLPEDAMQRFYYEGSGSPTISLSTLGDTEGDSETDDCYEYVNDMGDKFKKLARIYGMTPSVTFSPNDEVIGE